MSRTPTLTNSVSISLKAPFEISKDRWNPLEDLSRK